MKMIQKEGYWWPEDVGEKYRASLRRIKSLKIAIRLCQSRNRTRVVVQAGGSIGVWPKILSDYFGYVYTFEPEPVSFTCLYENVKASNVFKFPVALGNEHRTINMNRKSLTSHTVSGDGPIPMLRIDDFGFSVCDAILLDTEGFEFQILCGAAATISKCSPLILVENHDAQKDTVHNVSITDMIHTYLTSVGYQKSMHVEMDDIYEKN